MLRPGCSSCPRPLSAPTTSPTQVIRAQRENALADALIAGRPDAAADREQEPLDGPASSVRRFGPHGIQGQTFVGGVAPLLAVELGDAHGAALVVEGHYLPQL